jgi:hypothetical protein
MGSIGFSISGVGVLMASCGLAAGAGDPGVVVRLPDACVAEGRTKQALQGAVTRLCSPPLGDVAFVLSDLNFKLTRRFTEYSGDVSGRMLGALQAAAPLLGEDIPMIRTLADAIPGYQKADGHFGADQDLSAGVTQARDMPILWGNGRLLLALCERYRITRDPQVLAVAKRLGDYAISTRSYYGKRENFEKVGGAYASGYTTCYPSLIDGLAALGEVSGEAKYMEEARFIAGLSLLDAAFEKHHSHGRLTAYRGMLDIDQFTATSDFRAKVVAGCGVIRERFMLPTGGVTETFDRTDIRDEGCTEADWIRVNILLWRATGNAMYLDVAEGALRNHLLAMQFRNGGFGHHLSRTLQIGDRAYPWGGVSNCGAEAYWCCSMHGTQVLADVARWSVLESEGRLLVTWLGEARGAFVLDGQRVTAVTRETGPGAWEVQLESAEPLDVTLRLRVPGRAKAIRVDGQELQARDGWADHAVRAEGRSVIPVSLPSDVRIEGPYAPAVREGEPVRLFSGADLLCLADANVPDDLLAEDEVPEVLYDRVRAADGRVRAIVRKDGADVVTWLTPMISRPAGGCRYLLRATPASADRFAAAPAAFERREVPIEIVMSCDGSYELYLNGRQLAVGQSWVEGRCIDAYVPPGRNVLCVKVRSKSAHPGLMGKIELPQGHRVVTNARDWEAALWPETGRVSDLDSSGELVGLRDLGGFGVAPWKQMSGAYAGTGARWIWPEEPQPGHAAAWLVRTVFDVEAPASKE